MSRRRSSQPTISLFSFQDIVTSVTAILILVVLILSLELITRRLDAEAGDPGASARTVVEAVKEIETLVARLAAEPTSESAGDVDSPVPEHELQTLRDQVDRESKRLADARHVAGTARRMAEDARAVLARGRAEAAASEKDRRDAERLAAEAATAAAENAAEAERLESLRREIEGRPLPGQQLFFRRPEGTMRRSWLLEATDRGFAALELGTGRSTPLGADIDPDSGFTAWLAALRPATDYVLILARPSGIKAAESAEERLEAAGISHGIDVIGEGHTVHDGSAGAAP